MLVSTSIPNLLSGVSQQPASMRFPSQAEVQVNAYPSVIDGLIKRPPTEHVAKLVDGSAGPCHCHIINRDTTERYAVVFRVNQPPLVYDIVNDTFESVATPDGISYLSTSNPDKDLRVVTVADYTFVTNRNVVPEMLTTRTQDRGQECLITIVSGQYGCNYTVTFPDGATQRVYNRTTPNGATDDADDIRTDLIAQQLADAMLAGATGLNSGTAGGFQDMFAQGFGATTCVTARNGKVYVGSSGGLWISNSGGNLGSYVYRSTSNGLVSNFILSVAVGGDFVYVGTSEGLSVSSDGGTSFQTAITGRAISSVYSDGYRTTVGTRAGYGNTAAGVMTAIQGAAWTTSSTGLGSPNVNGVWSEGNTIYAATDDGFSTSTNGGVSYTNRKLHSGLFVSNKTNDVFLDKSTNKLYVAVGGTVSNQPFGTVWVSSDGGTTFSNLLGVTNIRAERVWASGNDIYVATYSQGLRVSNNGGATWTTVTFSGGLNNTVNGVWRDAGQVYVAYSLGLARQSLAGAQGHTDWQVSRQGSTIWVRRGASLPYGAFTPPEVTDSRNNTLTSLATNEVQNLVDLPLTAPHGYVAKVTGDPDAEEDEYFVRFKANAGSGFGSGLWEEAVQPDVPFELNPAKMPHILVRKDDGSFEFKEAVWDSRSVGNNDSSPEPSFVGRPIKDIFFFKNRLGFLADDKVVMSEAGKYFNFWRTTVLQVLDGDPIDLGVAHTKVALLNAAVPFSENLVLFSDQTQFLLSSGGDLLTPKTASITQTTEFRSLPGVRPVTNGKAVYFAEGRGGFSAMREYFQTSTDSKIFDAENLTQQVSAYIKGEILEIEPSTHDNIVFVRSSGAVDTLYGYKFLMNGTNRIQSAWFEMTFGGSDIKGIGWIDTSLFLFNQRSDGLFLERMVVEPGRTDPSSPVVIHLDRRMVWADQSTETTKALPTGAVIYNPLTGSTSITLPYEVRVGATVQVVSSHSPNVSGTVKHPRGTLARVLSISTDRKTVTVDEDWTGTVFFIGEKYEMVYRTSTPYIRQGESNVIVPQGRFQLTYGEIVFTNSSFFVVEVTPKYRDTYRYPFTGNIVGATAQVNVAPVVNGSFRFPVFAKNDEVTITIRNDSPLPCGLTSIDYEATYNTRSRRI